MFYALIINCQKGAEIMGLEQNEKTLRLHSALEEALQPILNKMDTLEKEVIALKEEQSELKKLLGEKLDS
jgi:cell shape-determining protein MreC